MQPQGQNPVRPLALQGQSELQQLFELVRAQQQNSRSAFSSLPAQPAALPEFSLYHAAQLSGILGNNGSHTGQDSIGMNQPGSIAGLPGMQTGIGQPLSQIAQLQQLQNLQNQAGLLNPPISGAEPSNGRAVPPRAVSRNEKSSTAYASRHQAAEQRRRNRINDRLDLLRKVVPHSERANTATFLEEVIKYVGELQSRVTTLESAQGLPLTCPPDQAVRQALNELTQPSQKILNVGTVSQSQPVMSGVSQPVTVFPESNMNTSNAAQSTLQKTRTASPSRSTGEVEGKGQDPTAQEETGPAQKRQKSAKVEVA